MQLRLRPAGASCCTQNCVHEPLRTADVYVHARLRHGEERTDVQFLPHRAVVEVEPHVRREAGTQDAVPECCAFP